MSEENGIPATEETVKLVRFPDLKAFREARGVTIEEIVLKTRISTTILDAIENGEFHLLPKPVYTKKFIQIYADAIGIDAGGILAHYQRHLDKTEAQAVPEEVKVVKERIAFNRGPFMRYLLYAVTVVAIVAAALVMYAFFYEKDAPPGSSHPGVAVDTRKAAVPPPAPTVKERPFEAVTSARRTPPETTAARKETAQTPGATQPNLLVEATEKTWLSITEDRNPPYQITLKAGEKLSRTAQESFVIDVGNAAGVNITFLGKSLGNLGRKGQVVHLRLPLR